MSHVFISYASRSCKLADRVRDGLERRGIRCWITPQGYPPRRHLRRRDRAGHRGSGRLRAPALGRGERVGLRLPRARAGERQPAPGRPGARRRCRSLEALSLLHRLEPVAEAPHGRRRGLDRCPCEHARAAAEAPPAEADVESVEAPGADSRRPRFAQHPVRWLGAGAAVLLVLVVVTVAIRWDPDDDGSDGSSGGTTTTGTTADPDDVAALRSHVRFAGCEEVAPEEQGESAELYYPPGTRISTVPRTRLLARRSRSVNRCETCCAPTASSVVRPEQGVFTSCRQNDYDIGTATTRAPRLLRERRQAQSSSRRIHLLIVTSPGVGRPAQRSSTWWRGRPGR